jgi:hypothetical protein
VVELVLVWRLGARGLLTDLCAKRCCPNYRGFAQIFAAQKLQSLHKNYERSLGPLKALRLSSDVSESQPATPNQSVGDNDIDGNQPIEPNTRDSVGPRSK